MPAILQPSFSRGEISPSLQSRVDLATYASAVARAENFIVLPEGGMQTRPGLAYCGRPKMAGSRLLRFVVSADIAYAVELGDFYARFWFHGELLPTEVVTPWSASDAWEVHYTQSVDVMFLAHQDFPGQTISRLTPTTFAIAEYPYREGPFRVINANETLLMSASAKTGLVQITANFDAFTADFVGALVKLEVKALGQIKPWTVGEQGVAVGAYRRSDGKVYRAVTVASGGTWSETGNVRPTHDTGREWDSGSSTRTNGVDTWAVGVEWEYVHSGYGIARITDFIDERTVTAQVQVPFPDEVVGGIGAPISSWDFVGDGVDTVFMVTGAVAASQLNYQVTLDGEPV
jgi:hypothetical protein